MKKTLLPDKSVLSVIHHSDEICSIWWRLIGVMTIDLDDENACDKIHHGGRNLMKMYYFDDK